MIQTLQTPRKRRRRLIVAFVLVFVSLGTWWYWPRGDVRFVGKWQWAGAGGGVVTLYRNGLAEHDDGRQTWYTNWTVQREHLFFGLPVTDSFNSARFDLVPLAATFLRQKLGVRVVIERGVFEFKVQDIAKDRIDLDGAYLHRIPE
jgi:hypothetical protein